MTRIDFKRFKAKLLQNIRLSQRATDIETDGLSLMAYFKKTAVIWLALSLALTVGGCGTEQTSKSENMIPETEPLNEGNIVTLPEPTKDSDVSIEEAFNLRKSVREYTTDSLTLREISQILWAAQGKNAQGSRTAPSAGALYPINVYIVSSSMNSLAAGIYKYQPESHALVRLAEGDYRSKLSAASLSQESIAVAPAVIVLSGVSERTTPKYGERGERFVYMEVGHVAQNILLQAVSLDLGTVSIGAFDDQAVNALLLMEKSEQPLYVLPIGRMPD